LRIIFFSPYFSFKGSVYVFYRASVPLNLLYIANYLRKFRIDSRVFDLGILDEKDVIRKNGSVRCGISDEAIVEILTSENPEIVGISSMFTIFHSDIVEIIKTIKRFNPKIRVVVGGNHASCFPGLILESGADQVVVGEGERAFVSVAKGNKDKIINFSLMECLDEIPFPFMNPAAFRRYSHVSNPYLMRPPAAGIITSRGCPNDCIYCTVNGVWKRRWRGRSPENVVDEMFILKRDFGIREIHFLDDNVSVDRERWMGILDLMIKRRLNIKFATPMAYWTIDEEVLDKMKAAGCYRLSFGIESGDKNTRKFIGKNYPLGYGLEMIKYANKIGLWTITTNIIGFPYEDRAAIQNTIDFAKNCETDFACFFNLIPHASSRVYPYFIKEKFISENDDIMSIMNEGGCRTLHFTKDELKALQKEAYAEFIRHKIRFYLRHPFALARKIRSIEDLFYMLKLIRFGVFMTLRSLSTKVAATSKDFIYGKRQYV